MIPVTLKFKLISVKFLFHATVKYMIEMYEKIKFTIQKDDSVNKISKNY